MLGFIIVAEPIELSVNTDEVEMAGWFTCGKIELSDGGIFHFLRTLSVSRRFIDDLLLKSKNYDIAT